MGNGSYENCPKLNINVQQWKEIIAKLCTNFRKTRNKSLGNSRSFVGSPLAAIFACSPRTIPLLSMYMNGARRTRKRRRGRRTRRRERRRRRRRRRTRRRERRERRRRRRRRRRTRRRRTRRNGAASFRVLLSLAERNVCYTGYVICTAQKILETRLTGIIRLLSKTNCTTREQSLSL